MKTIEAVDASIERTMRLLNRHWVLGITDQYRRWESYPNIVVGWHEAALLLGVHTRELMEIADDYGLRYGIRPGVYDVVGRRHYYLADIDLLLNWLEENQRDIYDPNPDWPGIPLMRMRNSNA